MKFLFILFSGVIFTFSALGQNNIRLQEYTASNGITYKVGDDFKLGRGSDTNGRFVYANMTGWAMSTNPQQNRLPAANAGLIVTIKKINKYNYRRNKGVFFTVGGGNITNYLIDIENAIATCEVVPCNNEQPEQITGKYDN